MEQQITKLVDQKIENSLKSTCKKVYQTYANFVSVDKILEQTNQGNQKSNKKKGNHIKNSF